MVEREIVKKTLHVTELTLSDLQNLKKQMGLRSLSEVIDCLVQLYNHTDSFPRGYIEFVDYTRINSGHNTPRS